MKPQIKKVIFSCILLILVGLTGSLSIDMYAPAMPAIAKTLGVSATAVQWSLSLYALVSLIGLFTYGALSDCFGRKRILLVGLSVGVFGAAICAMATTIHLFYLGRVLQGLGLAVVPSVLPAVSRDLFSGKLFQQVASIVSVAFGLGPVFSPLIGSYVSHVYGWHEIFMVLAFYALMAMLVVAFFLGETHDKEKRSTFNLKPMLRNYGMIITNPIFFKNMFAKAVAWMSFLVFYTASPFMLQEHLHMNMLHYGSVTLAITGAIFLSKVINTFLLNIMDVNAIVRMSLWIMVFGAALLLGFGIAGYYSVATIVGPFIIVGFASGFLFSNTMAASFQGFRGVSSGSVAGLLNGTQVLVGFLGSATAAHISINSLWPLGTLMTTASVMCLLVYYYLSRKQIA